MLSATCVLLPSTCCIYFGKNNCCQFLARLLLDTKYTSYKHVARPGNMLPQCKRGLNNFTDKSATTRPMGSVGTGSQLFRLYIDHELWNFWKMQIFYF